MTCESKDLPNNKARRRAVAHLSKDQPTWSVP
jgi:hypothetical protein